VLIVITADFHYCAVRFLSLLDLKLPQGSLLDSRETPALTIAALI
jgi:hypothetical protein